MMNTTAIIAATSWHRSLRRSPQSLRRSVSVTVTARCSDYANLNEWKAERSRTLLFIKSVTTRSDIAATNQHRCCIASYWFWLSVFFYYHCSKLLSAHGYCFASVGLCVDLSIRPSTKWSSLFQLKTICSATVPLLPVRLILKVERWSVSRTTWTTKCRNRFCPWLRRPWASSVICDPLSIYYKSKLASMTKFWLWP